MDGYLDTALVTRACAAAPPSMAAKRQALAGLVEQLLVAHHAGFAGRVEQRVRAATLDGADRADRVALMGEVARYAEVTHEGETEGVLLASGGRLDAAHRFDLRVWLGYQDAATYGQSSQALFDRVAESRSAPFGLLSVLRAQPYLITEEGEVAVEDVRVLAATIVPLVFDLAAGGTVNAEHAHFLHASVTIQ